MSIIDAVDSSSTRNESTLDGLVANLKLGIEHSGARLQTELKSPPKKRRKKQHRPLHFNQLVFVQEAMSVEV